MNKKVFFGLFIAVFGIATLSLQKDLRAKESGCSVTWRNDYDEFAVNGAGTGASFSVREFGTAAQAFLKASEAARNINLAGLCN